MAEFIGRHSELKRLDDLYKGDKFEFVAIYGRRRVGKTALINEFVKDKRHIFVTARRISGNVNFNHLGRKVSEFEGTENGKEYRDLDDILESIANISNERLILVIDEYPYFAESNEEISSALQVYIDHKFQFSKLFLILCGSSMSFMMRQVLGYESPLYGRRTHEIKLEPMDYYQSSEFMDGRSPTEMATIYGMVGGVPLYLKRFSSKRQLSKIAVEEFLADGTILSTEPESLLSQELKDPKRYNAVILAAASGCNRVNEIRDRTGISDAEVTRYLTDLMDLGYIKKIAPINDKNSKRTRYVLSDNLFRFYYSVISDNRDDLIGFNTDNAAKELNRFLPGYMGATFEDICGQYIRRFLRYNTIGKWWGSSSKRKAEVEIDVVASRSHFGGKRDGMFAECKFTNAVVDSKILRDLKDKAAEVGGFDNVRYILFSKTGFSEDLENIADQGDIFLVTLDNMYCRFRKREVIEVSYIANGSKSEYRRKYGVLTDAAADSSVDTDDSEFFKKIKEHNRTNDVGLKFMCGITVTVPAGKDYAVCEGDSGTFEWSWDSFSD
jgi:AAA+ ATPase superfamily predicted ATPase